MDIGSLVSLAGNTLVTAAVTDAWESARQRISQMFGRGRPDPAIERRLHATRERLLVTSPRDLDRVRAELAARWATRLGDLLEDHPDTEAALRVFVDEVSAMLPAEAVTALDHSVAAGENVNIFADRGSVAAGVFHGNVAPPDPTPPGPASG